MEHCKLSQNGLRKLQSLTILLYSISCGWCCHRNRLR